MNVLPRSARPGAKKDLQEIYKAEDRTHAEKAITAFDKTYGAKWSKAVKKITGESDELLAFYDFPAEHWIHLRMTPVWPPADGEQRPMMHFDFQVGDLDSAVALGTTAAESQPQENVRVLFDPAGHPFCLCFDEG